MEEKISKECRSAQHGFSYIHSISHGENVSASHIDKDLFSVFILLDGEIDYIIEGKRLHLSPKDMLLVGNNELHQSIFKKGLECEYILLMLNLDFFIKHNCTELSDIFFNLAHGSDNIIKGERVVESGIYNIVNRLDSYAGEENPNLVVVSSVIIELLYNLDRQVTKSGKQNFKQERIKDIIEYINANLTEKISLEDIAARFYLTRQYLCRLFKQSTGFTVNKYISYKRIVLVRELHLGGMPLSIACERAGFGDYSAFYRAYSKIIHEPPHKSISQMNF